MQTEEFGGEKERDGGRKGERESAPRMDVGVATLGAWKKEINGSGSCSTPPLKIFPYRLQCIPAFSPFSLFMKFRQSFLSSPFLYLSFIISFSLTRERESCVYIFLISPFRPQYNSLMLLLFLSPPSLYNLHPPQSQYSVVYIVLNLNSGVITAWAVQLRCVCVGGVLAAAW